MVGGVYDTYIFAMMRTQHITGYIAMATMLLLGVMLVAFTARYPIAIYVLSVLEFMTQFNIAVLGFGLASLLLVLFSIVLARMNRV